MTNDELIVYLENRIELVEQLSREEILCIFQHGYPIHYGLLSILATNTHALDMIQTGECSEESCNDPVWLKYLEKAQEIDPNPTSFTVDIKYILDAGIMRFLTLNWCNALCARLAAKENFRLNDHVHRKNIEHAFRMVLMPRNNFAPGDFSVTYRNSNDQARAGNYWKTIHDMGLRESVRNWITDPVMVPNPLLDIDVKQDDGYIIQEVTQAIYQGWEQYVDDRLDQYAAELQQAAPA